MIWWHLFHFQIFSLRLAAGPQDSSSLHSDWRERAPSSRPVRNTSCFLTSWSWLEFWSTSSGARPASKYPQPAEPPWPLPRSAPSPAPSPGAAACLVWLAAGPAPAGCTAGPGPAPELAGGRRASRSSVCLCAWACCCLCSWSSICSCCSWELELPATLRTPLSWDSSSAIGSTAAVSRALLGDSVDSGPGPPADTAEPGPAVLELAGLLWRRVRWDRPPRPWAMRLQSAAWAVTSLGTRGYWPDGSLPVHPPGLV